MYVSNFTSIHQIILLSIKSELTHTHTHICKYIDAVIVCVCVCVCDRESVCGR